MRQMITLAKFSIDYILPLIGSESPKILIHTNYGNFKVKAGTLRLQTFKRNLSCVNCNRTGSIFLLQSSIKNDSKKLNCLIKDCLLCCNIYNKRITLTGDMESPHLNMFHVNLNGGLTLMTKDHIIPKSKGGPDTLENLQTMCELCNKAKADQMPEEFARNGFKKRPIIQAA